jgi:hypothetical protein
MIIFFQAQLSDEKFLDDHTGKEVGKFVNAWIIFWCFSFDFPPIFES